jgi:hypothetical protein
MPKETKEKEKLKLSLCSFAPARRGPGHRLPERSDGGPPLLPTAESSRLRGSQSTRYHLSPEMPPGNSSPLAEACTWQNAAAGSAAGFATVAALHQLDVVRTRFQGNPSHRRP